MKFQLSNTPLEVFAKAQIYPSEDIEKVKLAINNLINNVEDSFKLDNEMIEIRTKKEEALQYIYEKIRSKQTYAVARKLLLRNQVGDSTYLNFNKQAAFMNVVNICEDEDTSPLGSIKIIIKSPVIMQFIDWIAPK